MSRGPRGGSSAISCGAKCDRRVAATKTVSSCCHDWVRLLLWGLCCLCLASCAGAPLPPKSEMVTVNPVGPRPPGERRQIKREQLAAEIMRYADRYAARMALEADRIDEQATDMQLRYFATGWKLQARTAVLNIAVGPNAVENLLDMLVLSTLARYSVETYWAPTYLGGQTGAGLLEASRQLEEEAWSEAARVLTTEQQDALRGLITQWTEKNPDQHYIWAVRFSGFSGQRAADLARVSETGGLLAEAQRAREAVDEVRAFSERVLYYMLRAPGLTRLEAQFGILEVLRMPEVQRLLDDTERVTRSTERYADFVEKLPSERDAAINQLMDGMTGERETAINQFMGELSREREAAIYQLMGELSRERDAALTQVMNDQLRTVQAFLTSDEFIQTLEQIRRESSKIADITFLRGAILILLWMIAYVIAKLVIQYLSSRMGHRAGSRNPDPD